MDGGDAGIECAPSCPQSCPLPTVQYTFAQTCAVVAGDGGHVFGCWYTAYPVDIVGCDAP